MNYDTWKSNVGAWPNAGIGTEPKRCLFCRTALSARHLPVICASAKCQRRFERGRADLAARIAARRRQGTP